MIALHTRQTRVLATIFLIAGGALLIVLLLRFDKTEPVSKEAFLRYDADISIGSTTIPVTIADSPDEQEQGLSGTVSLSPDTGKLFVFNTPGVYGFWMKDMNYPIDIIWIDEHFTVAGLSLGLTPESYPTVFYPPKKVKYVLEVNAGFSTQHNISINQSVTIFNKPDF